MTRPQKLAVLGASGFIGSALIGYGRGHGFDVTPIVIPRVKETGAGGASIAEAVELWCLTNKAAFDGLCDSLAPYQVVVNAAGDARAASRPTPALRTSNAVLPAIMARAARLSGVRRLVHISSAAVQGRLDSLDESEYRSPLSPYAASKAEGERALFEADRSQDEVRTELLVYRPTSVQAVGRRATRTFARVMSCLPVVPLVGSGDQQVPVALLDNVSAGILFAAHMPNFTPIVLQPSEGMTARRLAKLFGARRTLAVPAPAATFALDQAARATRRSATGTSHVRWLELMLRGQRVEAKALSDAGFTLPVGSEGWEAIARTEQARRQGS